LRRARRRAPSMRSRRPPSCPLRGPRPAPLPTSCTAPARAHARAEARAPSRTNIRITPHRSRVFARCDSAEIRGSGGWQRSVRKVVSRAVSDYGGGA
jgi:hypothetical protein